jgi:hypothetical protein
VSKTTTELKSSLPSGFDSSVWALSGSVNAGHPYLQWQTGAAPSTTAVTLPGTVPDTALLSGQLNELSAQILNQKPNSFSLEIDTTTAGSTPSSAPAKASIWQAIPVANADAISAVKSDERIKAALTDIEVEALTLFLSGGSSYVSQKVGDIYGLWVLFNSSQPASWYVRNNASVGRIFCSDIRLCDTNL